jgi:type IV pilus assembly protein PilO
LRVEVLVTANRDWLREFTVETPARLVVTGRYHQVGAFLADLGRQPRSMRVNNFVIERSSQPGMVTMKGVVSIHRYLTDEEAAVERKRAETKK